MVVYFAMSLGMASDDAVELAVERREVFEDLAIDFLV
jgi:hypothetical protein